MNTAVPGTRTGGVATITGMKSSSGIARAVSRSATIRRPVFHVVISVKMNAPISSGNQPPCSDLQQVGAEERQVDGQEDGRHARPRPASASASARSATTYSSSAVITIVIVTAMP